MKQQQIYNIQPSCDGWLIRRNTVATACCADRDSAWDLACAMARGECTLGMDEIVVRIAEHVACSAEPDLALSGTR